MRSIIITSRDEHGERTPGFVFVRNGVRHAAMQQSVIDQGLEALKTPGLTEQRRTAIREWVGKASKSWPLPDGEYPLDGKRAVVIDDLTIERREAIRNEAAYRRALTVSTTRAPQPSTVTPATVASAIAQARRILADVPSSKDRAVSAAVAKARQALVS